MKQLLKGTIGFIIVLLFWAISAYLVSRPLLPGPLSLLLSSQNADILQHLAISLWRIIAGVSAAVVIGLPLGISAAVSSQNAHWINNLTWFVYPIPKVLFLPVLLLLTGIGDLSKIILICLSLVFFLIVSVRDSIRSLSPEYIRTIQSMGGTKIHFYTYLYLPAILPSLISTLKIGLGIAGGVLFFAENFGTDRGIAWFIMDARVRFDYPALYSGILSLGLSLWILLSLLFLIEHFICPWSETSRRDS